MKKRYTETQIVAKLRQADVLIGKGDRLMSYSSIIFSAVKGLRIRILNPNNSKNIAGVQTGVNVCSRR